MPANKTVTVKAVCYDTARNCLALRLSDDSLLAVDQASIDSLQAALSAKGWAPVA